MRVTGKDTSLTADAYVKNTQTKQKGEISSTQSDEANPKKDKVALSAKAKQLREAKKTLNATPEMRQGGVAQVKKQIRDGTYQIDGRKVAANMVRDSLLSELLLDKRR